MRRVNESVRQVLAEAVPELKDPRIGLVTVTGVDTAADLRHATVYVSVLGSGRKRRATLTGQRRLRGKSSKYRPRPSRAHSSPVAARKCA